MKQSTSSVVLSPLSIWNINVQARLAMPSLASCFLPIDFSSVYPHPSISRGVGGCLSSELQHQSSSPRPPPDPGLFSIPAWLISAETLERLQTSEDNPRCWKRGPGKGAGWGGLISMQQWRTVQSRERLSVIRDESCSGSGQLDFPPGISDLQHFHYTDICMKTSYGIAQRCASPPLPAPPSAG